jgi:hypothetical protein
MILHFMEDSSREPNWCASGLWHFVRMARIQECIRRRKMLCLVSWDSMCDMSINRTVSVRRVHWWGLTNCICSVGRSTNSSINHSSSFASSIAETNDRAQCVDYWHSFSSYLEPTSPSTSVPISKRAPWRGFQTQSSCRDIFRPVLVLSDPLIVCLQLLSNHFEQLPANGPKRATAS